MNTRSRDFKIVFLFALFIVFRSASLTRDLAFEEATYLLPGRNLGLGHGFTAYMGELNPVFSPFHKPPFASLFPGLFSFLSNDWMHAGRLFGLLISLWICSMGVLFFDSFLVSFIAIVSPFLLAAATHMQTDPTVGLLGFSLISLYFALNEQKPTFLILGFVALWCGKFELAVCAGFASVLIFLILPLYRKRFFTKDLILANLIGIGSFFAVSGLLSLTRGDSFFSPVFSISGIILGAPNMIQANLNKSASRADIRAALQHQKYFHFLALSLLPILYLYVKLYLKKKLVPQAFQKAIALFLLAAVVFVVFYTGAYAGDGFPRYYLATIPPLLCLIAFAEKELRPFRYFAPTAIAVSALLFIPRSIQHLRTPLGITGYGTRTGYREAANLVKAFTQKNDLIVAPEASSPYLEDRKLLIDFTLGEEAYPEIITNYKDKIQAAIMAPIRETMNTPSDQFQKQLLQPLIQKGAIKISVGSYDVWVLRPKQ